MKSLLEREKEKAQEAQTKAAAQRSRTEAVAMMLLESSIEYLGRNELDVDASVTGCLVTLRHKADGSELRVTIFENSTEQPRYKIETKTGAKSVHPSGTMVQNLQNQDLALDDALDRMLEWLKR